MNFFAHCAVAAWTTEAPAFALGSMLPDFATMSGGRLNGAEHEEVGAGITHHHATDAVFHAAPTFVDLCRRSSGRMDDVRWGTARAVAHIGVELFLDGWLLERVAEEVPRQYLQALERARPDDLGSSLRWRDPTTADRFEGLRQRLLHYGLPEEIGEPQVVFARLERALAGRKRLCILDDDARSVRAELEIMIGDVFAHAEALMEEVAQGLNTRSGPSG